MPEYSTPTRAQGRISPILTHIRPKVQVATLSLTSKILPSSRKADPVPDPAENYGELIGAHRTSHS